jgi:hypothetical protein
MALFARNSFDQLGAGNGMGAGNGAGGVTGGVQPPLESLGRACSWPPAVFIGASAVLSAA